MPLGLGWAEWLTIVALLGGLILTFFVMARASVAYDKARQARQAGEQDKQEGKEGKQG